MVNIRKAKEEDMDFMKQIDTFVEQLDSFGGLDAIDPAYRGQGGYKSYYGSYIRGKKKWCYVAEEKDDIVGFILFNIEKRPQYYKVKQVGYIDLLVVKEAKRGRGIGKTLFDTARETLKKEGINYLKLSVHVDNFAHAAWRRMGFEDYRIDMWRRI